MKHKVLLLLLGLLLVSCVKEDNRVPVRIEEDGKYGYIDTDGNVMIPPQYCYAGKFYNGLALVVVDTTTIHKVDSLRNLALTTDTLVLRYGYINNKNKFVIKPNLQQKIETKGMLGNSLDLQPYNGDIMSFIDDKIGFRNKELSAFQNEKGLYGFIDRKGKIKIPAVYSDTKGFSEGKAPVKYSALLAKDSLDNKKLNNWGCINNKGEVVIDFDYSSMERYRMNRTFASILDEVEEGNFALSASKFLLDEKGHIIGEELSKWLNYGNFCDSIATVYPNTFGEWMGYTCSFIDIDGNPLKAGRGKSGDEIEYIIDTDPHKFTILPDDFEFLDITRFTNGYAAVKIGTDKRTNQDAWLFLDTNLIVCGKDEDNLIFQGAMPFSEGLAAVKVDDKWGYIDTTFNMVIPCRFDNAGYFERGIAIVVESKNDFEVKSYINKDGKVIWQSKNRKARPQVSDNADDDTEI